MLLFLISFSSTQNIAWIAQIAWPELKLDLDCILYGSFFCGEARKFIMIYLNIGENMKNSILFSFIYIIPYNNIQYNV